ncbi:MAG: aliphatic sulfonates family transporter, periplasmic ligand-binding protein [Cypionkella sp.]|uniref:aliphatic sulfonate ABC transporter substrate-binding protein n=1 Tax=Cypionkella sp. TaxID=2811411 RepID=UPI00262AF12B|nr:aliphatic sulfonate ABC transporter substrate-binding protein [Cypionkella sp.]MDB5659914.1 aliphatic sulfonates family transporter, periplasmic ligand-binding protein [Cypionkella sp.]
MLLSRRAFGASALLLTTAFAFSAHAEKVTTLKIGYQKTNLPVVAKQLGLIEKALEPQGVAVEWVEFAAGPPLVEALNVGAIHLGWTGDAPPIFGQSAGSAIVYVAALPSNGDGEAVFTKSDSGIKTIADLKGKKVGVGKGTSAHNLLVAALEANGLKLSDIEVVYLGPADAAAAFASDAIVAWSVWDPFFAIAETKYQPTILAKSSDVLKVNTYFLANRDFAADADNAAVITTTIAALGEAATWADANRDKVAETVAEVTGVPIEAQTLAVNRAKFGIYPITPEIIAGQQATADRFFGLGLIPTAVKISDAIWTAPN